jgi:hypothetical protein
MRQSDEMRDAMPFSIFAIIEKTSSRASRAIQGKI